MYKNATADHQFVRRNKQVRERREKLHTTKPNADKKTNDVNTQQKLNVYVLVFCFHALTGLLFTHTAAVNNH